MPLTFVLSSACPVPGAVPGAAALRWLFVKLIKKYYCYAGGPTPPEKNELEIELVYRKENASSS